MRRAVGRGETGAEFAALEAYAEGAGRALACIFSTSDELEADLIRERRAAGLYRPGKHKERILTLAAVGAALVLVVIFAI